MTQLVCAVDGCHESSFFESATLRDRRDSLLYYSKHPYRCTRHVKPDEVLSADNPASTQTLTVVAGHRGPVWQADGERLTPSSLFGPGFRTFAKDFPLGTRLTITARIEVPDGEQ